MQPPAILKRALAVIYNPDRLFNPLVVVIAVLLPVVLTFFAWRTTLDAVKQDARIRFEFKTNQMTAAISDRLLAYEQVLRGAAGLFAASKSVGRDEWRAYFESLKIDAYFPGVQGLGFAKHIASKEKETHITAVRAEGFPGYTIHPEGEHPEYAPIVYLEPFSGRNLRAFGYDMYSEPVRRAAMDQARDTGGTALSGKTALIQEIDTDVQAGFLMYAPLYQRSRDLVTVEQRRAALLGHVYGAFRMDDFIRSILDEAQEIALTIHDGVYAGEAALLYDSSRGGAGSGPRAESLFTMSNSIIFRDHIWTVHMNSLPPFEATIDNDKPRLVLFGGIAIDLLFFAVIWSLWRTRARALRLAQSMTAEVRAQQAEAEAMKERLSLALEGSNLALFDWDLGTGEVHLSEHWQEIIGDAPKPTVTTISALQAMVHPEDLPALQEQLYEVLKGSAQFYRVEHRVKCFNGEWKWILSRAKVAERDGAGRALRVAGTNADISAGKEIERLKNEFIATVSHELRTPLTGIIGALSLIKEDSTKLSGESAMFLDMAYENSERLASIINDFLNLEKIESGQMEFRIEPIGIAPFLEKAANINAAYAEKFDVRFELQRPLPDVKVRADTDRLLQVMTNLMSNAVKFSPKGAAVGIAAELRNSSLRVSVRDRGPGIPPEFHSRIFGRFAQADSSDTRQKGGTGLGLSISKVIVEKMGGRIGFESEPGQGATFYFELPIEKTGR